MISIVIPTYNEEKYIEKTLAQFTKVKIPYEVIVTDDKSTDVTASIAKKFTNKVLVPTTKHATIGTNRNAGAEISQGEFLVFIDSTCLLQNIEAFFEKALSNFQSDPNLIALTCKLDIYPETKTFSDHIMYFNFNTINYIKNNIFHIGEAPGKFQMIRSSSFKKVGGFREDLVTREDADLFYRLSKLGKTRYDGSITVLHSGRRAHAIGWPKLLSIWMINTVWMNIFGKSKTTNWERWWEKGLYKSNK